VDEATWAALAATLTVLGLVWSWTAFRRRGASSGLRALAFALLPAAAWLTGTLKMLTEITQSVSSWATGLVFNPATWTGIGFAGLSVVLFVVSGFLRDRQLARGQAARGEVPSSDQTPRKAVKAPPKKGAGPVDDDMADIEAILRSRGIE
jgi:hypothetical protein